MQLCLGHELWIRLIHLELNAIFDEVSLMIPRYTGALVH